MAVAANFKKYAEALLYQLELPLQGIQKTVQGLSAAALACYRRAILNGTWTKSKFRPKQKTARKSAVVETAWQQRVLMLTA